MIPPPAMYLGQTPTTPVPNPTAVAHRLLYVLRRTYPGWDIVRGKDESGEECWQARLRADITPALRDASVVEVLQKSDGITLASALAHQQALVHNFRATQMDPRPRTA
ncbi:hypothetical protein [Nonomuraea basaltis]|uniref:hypothetical protein n=1 Tax=Nonomuraea basaltis TaxID=2495887 RepID=UPI00110C435E|nr:hypothetical protein [Nonomuraea basaltis]TMR97324.1 hypothetical protein EJK15_18810 [Nonomuraea basaltis]